MLDRNLFLFLTRKFLDVLKIKFGISFLILSGYIVKNLTYNCCVWRLITKCLIFSGFRKKICLISLKSTFKCVNVFSIILFWFNPCSIKGCWYNYDRPILAKNKNIIGPTGQNCIGPWKCVCGGMGYSFWVFHFDGNF